MAKEIELSVNGTRYELVIRDNMTLLELLRGRLGLTGAKVGCDGGECGACTVLVGGKPVLSCLLLVADVGDREVLTIEGVESEGRLSQIQESFISKGAIQCGYCTPGMVLTAEALLSSNGSPSEGEIREGLAGNLCRCTGYTKIIDAVRHASEQLASDT